MSVSRVSILFLGLSIVAVGCSDPSSASTSPRDEPTVAAAPVADLTGAVLFGRYEGDVEHYLTTTPEGARETEIFDAEGCAPCVVLSPDGEYVSTPAFSDDVLTTAIVSVDGTERRVLSLPGIAGAWSPDSRLLAVGVWVEDASKTGVYTARAADGAGLRQITTSGHDEFHEPFAWSPDGRRILIFVERGSIGGVTHAGDLFVARTDGSGGMRRLNPPGVAVGRVTAAGSPASWSPDGRSVAFAAFDRGTDGDRSAVFVTDASDGRARRISGWGSMIASAAWSPTDDLIAFSELDGPDISLVTPGGELGSLSVPGWRISGPVWSPDGSHLLVRRAVGLGGVLVVVDLHGDVVSTVTRRPGNLFGWAWEGSG